MRPKECGIGSGRTVCEAIQPMAIVVIGGLITSTFLSLLAIPVVYSYVDDARQWVRRRAKLHGEPRVLHDAPL